MRLQSCRQEGLLASSAGLRKNKARGSIRYLDFGVRDTSAPALSPELCDAEPPFSSELSYKALERVTQVRLGKGLAQWLEVCCGQNVCNGPLLA